MKYLFLLFLLLPILLFAQKTEYQACPPYERRFVRSFLIDSDIIPDKAYIDKCSNQIVLVLSEKNDTVRSGEILLYSDFNDLEPKKPGTFFLKLVAMRGGAKFTFRYNQQTEQVDLIGYDTYGFGNANNCGSGTSSYNLLTGDFIGNWKACVTEYEEHTTLKSKVKLAPQHITLAVFSEEIHDQISDPIVAIYTKLREEKVKHFSGYKRLAE